MQEGHHNQYYDKAHQLLAEKTEREAISRRITAILISVTRSEDREAFFKPYFLTLQIDNPGVYSWIRPRCITTAEISPTMYERLNCPDPGARIVIQLKQIQSHKTFIEQLTTEVIRSTAHEYDPHEILGDHISIDTIPMRIAHILREP